MYCVLCAVHRGPPCYRFGVGWWVCSRIFCGGVCVEGVLRCVRVCGVHGVCESCECSLWEVCGVWGGFHGDVCVVFTVCVYMCVVVPTLKRGFGPTCEPQHIVTAPKKVCVCACVQKEMCVHLCACSERHQ